MTDSQWNQLLAVVRAEQLDPLPVGFIIDSPWLALGSKVSVHDVAYPALHEKLLAAKQVVDASQLPAPKPKAAKRSPRP